jgi:hypothetical protein
MDRLPFRRTKVQRLTATKTEFVKPSTPSRLLEPTQSNRLQRLIDDSVNTPHTLTPSQLATLQAILHRILPPEAQPTQPNSSSGGPPDNKLPHIAFHYQPGLDELDNLARLLTCFPFADLTPEIQDAMLALVASRDINTRKLDLSLWLNDLQTLIAHR